MIAIRLDLLSERLEQKADGIKQGQSKLKSNRVTDERNVNPRIFSKWKIL